MSCCVNFQASKFDGNDVLGPEQSQGTCQPSRKAFWQFIPPFCFQAQLRSAAQKLSQLQGKFESQAQITKGDIVILLRQGNIGLARAKAEGVIRDEVHSDLLQTLEIYLQVVLEQFSEIERRYHRFCRFVDPPPIHQMRSG